MAINFNVDEAETIALNVLGYLAESPAALERFIRDSGATIDHIRESTEDRHFLLSVMEFLMANEDLLVAFAESSKINPKDLGVVHHVLSR